MEVLQGSCIIVRNIKSCILVSVLRFYNHFFYILCKTNFVSLVKIDIVIISFHCRSPHWYNFIILAPSFLLEFRIVPIFCQFVSFRRSYFFHVNNIVLSGAILFLIVAWMVDSPLSLSLCGRRFLLGAQPLHDCCLKFGQPPFLFSMSMISSFRGPSLFLSLLDIPHSLSLRDCPFLWGGESVSRLLPKVWTAPLPILHAN